MAKLQRLNPRTIKDLEDRGLVAVKVETYNAFSGRSHDLFGIFDVLAVGENKTLGVQVTSWSATSTRAKKILEGPNLPFILSAGWTVLLYGWRKPKIRYERKILELDPRSLEFRRVE